MTDTRPPRPALAIALIAGFALGFVVLEAVTAGIVLLWETVPSTLAPGATAPGWYVTGLLVLAALLVYAARRFLGDHGHSPIGGFRIEALEPRRYAGVILAIVASLWGGVVLGPEVALVATGSMIGTVTAARFAVTGPARLRVVSAGAAGAILALFAGPILAGTLSLGSAPEGLHVDQLAWAVPVAAATALIVALARLIATLVARAAGPRPHLGILVGSALVVASAAMALTALTGEAPLLIVTSGEELITELPEITSAPTLAAIVVLKAIAYAVCLGAGFRGGPFFPAMFIGAAVGLLGSLALPGGPAPTAAMVVGVIAGIVATAPMRWPIALVLGAAVGYAMAGWVVVPVAVLGAAVARAIPRWADRPRSAPHHDDPVRAAGP